MYICTVHAYIHIYIDVFNICIASSVFKSHSRTAPLSLLSTALLLLTSHRCCCSPFFAYCRRIMDPSVENTPREVMFNSCVRDLAEAGIIEPTPEYGNTELAMTALTETWSSLEDHWCFEHPVFGLHMNFGATSHSILNIVTMSLIGFGFKLSFMFG